MGWGGGLHVYLKEGLIWLTCVGGSYNQERGLHHVLLEGLAGRRGAHMAYMYWGRGTYIYSLPN